MRGWTRILPLAFAIAAAPAAAGPPYLTDDPVPTDPGGWEVYAFTAGEGRRSAFDGDLGLDLNYGAVDDVQLTATLPLSASHEPGAAWRSGSGDVEFGVKYRFMHDEQSGFSAAIFPRVILPTAAHSPGGKTRFLLPVWLEKDFPGGVAVFGGGGYELNPGRESRNFWQAGLAVTKEVTGKLSVGGELMREGADTRGATAQTRASVGAIVQLSAHRAILVSAGPTWADNRTGYHFYADLGFDF